MQKEEEARLMALARQETRFFKPIYEKYFKNIFGFVYRRVLDQQTAEDIVSSCFVRSISSLHSFRNQGYGVSPWLYKIANNCIIDHFRQQKKRAKNQSRNIDQAIITATPFTHSLQQEHATQQKKLLQRVLSCLETLSQEEQLIISLKFFEKKKNTEISEIMDCSVNSLGVKLHRTLNKLRKLCDLPAEVIS